MSQLADQLADLYPERDKARLLLLGTGLDPEHINLDGDAVLRWERILDEAWKRHAISDLAEAVAREYPQRATEVADAAMRYMEERDGPRAGGPSPGDGRASSPRWRWLALGAVVLAALGLAVWGLNSDVFREDAGGSPTDEPQLSNLADRRIDLVFQDVDIRQAMAEAAKQVGALAVIAPEIQGRRRMINHHGSLRDFFNGLCQRGNFNCTWSLQEEASPPVLVVQPN
jgi:effector-associated domain 1 (EAD1)-containing protein